MSRASDRDPLAPLRAERAPRPRGDESGRFVNEVMRQVALRPSPARGASRRRTTAWLSFGALVSAGAVAAFVALHHGAIAPTPSRPSSSPSLSGTVAAASRTESTVRVRLTLRAPDASAVAVAGELNDWKPTACARAADGSWTVELAVPPGRYRYSFVVDGAFIGDPAAALVADDDFGGSDAILVV